MTAEVVAGRLVEFGRRLRAAGLVVTPDVSADMIRAVDEVGYGRPDRLLHALRAVTITDRSHIAVFDRVASEFLGLGHVGEQPQVTISGVSALGRVAEGSEGPEDAGDGGLAVEVGSSTEERLAHRDFATLDDEELAAVRRLIARMTWEPPMILSRRRVAVRRGDRPDLRRSLRAAVGPSGDLLPLSWTARQARRRPLIVIADISGSMEAYAETFLVFAHAARHRFGPVEAFVFATRLTRITRAIDRRDLTGALRRVASDVEDWSGGTRIGEAIAAFNRDWSRRVCRGKPIVMILSDGWDRGDPELLGREMARLSRTVARVIWLNPLAARKDYLPETRGMRAALPHVDDLLPAASVHDLQGLISLLDREA